jgi:nucleoside recognition membrane protein YjiH
MENKEGEMGKYWKDFNMALVYVLLSVAIFSQWIDPGYSPCTIVPQFLRYPQVQP